MSGHHHPLTCCDLECALVNGCREGGYQCERCGRWCCGSELAEDALCKDCAAEVAREREEEDEINDEWFGEIVDLIGSICKGEH